MKQTYHIICVIQWKIERKRKKCWQMKFKTFCSWFHFSYSIILIGFEIHQTICKVGNVTIIVIFTRNKQIDPSISPHICFPFSIKCVALWSLNEFENVRHYFRPCSFYNYGSDCNYVVQKSRLFHKLTIPTKNLIFKSLLITITNQTTKISVCAFSHSFCNTFF